MQPPCPSAYQPTLDGPAPSSHGHPPKPCYRTATLPASLAPAIRQLSPQPPQRSPHPTSGCPIFATVVSSLRWAFVRKHEPFYSPPALRFAFSNTSTASGRSSQ